MTELGSYIVVCFGMLSAVLNPLATVPPFLAMTESDRLRDRLRMAGHACLVAFFVLSIFSISGLTVLTFFGISVSAFKIAGGILLLRASLEMIKGSRARISAVEQEEGTEKEDISITPLAVPLLCGPITITTGILLSARATSWLHYPVLVLLIAVMYLTTYICLRLAVIHSGLLGDITLRVISRLMGLLLAALAVQFVVNGLYELGYTAKDPRTVEVLGPGENLGESAAAPEAN